MPVRTPGPVRKQGELSHAPGRGACSMAARSTARPHRPPRLQPPRRRRRPRCSKINTETFSTGAVPNKDDISNVYAIDHQVPPNPAIPSPNDTHEIYAAFERVVNNGDSHVDLEFLQQPVSLVPGSKPSAFPGAGKFKGDRTQGDLLLSVDFT